MRNWLKTAFLGPYGVHAFIAVGLYLALIGFDFAYDFGRRVTFYAGGLYFVLIGVDIAVAGWRSRRRHRRWVKDMLAMDDELAAIQEKAILAGIPRMVTEIGIARSAIKKDIEEMG